MYITFDPWIPLLRIYPTEVHAYLYTDVGTMLFITTLFEREKKKKANSLNVLQLIPESTTAPPGKKDNSQLEGWDLYGLLS